MPRFRSARSTAMLLAAVGGLIVGFEDARPALARALQPETYEAMPRPTVDYRGKVNEPAKSASDDDRAWLVVVEVMPDMLRNIDRSDLGVRPIPDELPDARFDEAWQATRTWVTTYADTIERLREASRRPLLGYVYRQMSEASPEEQLLFRAMLPRDPGELPPLAPADEPKGSLDRALFAISLPHHRPIETAARALQAHAWMLFHDARGTGVYNAPVEAEAGPGDEAAAPGTAPAPQSDAVRVAEEATGPSVIAVDATIGDRILDDLEAAARFGRLLMNEPIQGTQQAGLGIYNRAIGQLVEMIYRDPNFFTNEHLERMKAFFGPVGDPLPDLSVETQRLVFLDMLQRTYSDTGDGNGYLTLFGAKMLALDAGMMLGLPPEKRPLIQFGRPPEYVTDDQLEVQALIADDRETVRRRWEAAFTEYLAWHEKPLWERGPNTIEVEGIDLLRRPFDVAETVPLASGVREEAVAVVEMRRDSLLVLIAMIQARRDDPEGGWPASFDEMVPQYLEAVPVDQFAGEPMIYAFDDTGAPMLYGRGADLDDDRGAFPARVGSRESWDASAWVPREVAEARRDTDPNFPNGDLIFFMFGEVRFAERPEAEGGAGGDAGGEGGAPEVEGGGP